MKITRLSLTNFRSFKAAQEIDFADLTLLFGPNSVGKSSVLLALFYLQEVINKGHCNPQRIEALGNRFVGGFQNLVHGRDPSRDIVLKVEYDKEGAIGSTYCQTVAMLDELENIDSALLLEDIATGTEKVALEFVIAWSDATNTAYVKGLSVWLNDQFAGEISSDAGLKNPQVSALNLQHQLLLPANHEDWLDEHYHEGGGHLHSCWSAHFDAIDYSLKPESPKDVFSDDGFISELDEILEGQKQFGIMTRAGALPEAGVKLRTAFSTDSYITTSIVDEVLSELFVSPLDDLLSLLDDSLCIGPLRCIPDNMHQPNQHPKQGDWYDGTACWDVLSKPQIARDSAIGSWLHEEGGLALGYSLVYAVEKSETRFISADLKLDDIADLAAIYNMGQLNIPAKQLPARSSGNNAEVHDQEILAAMAQLAESSVDVLREGGGEEISSLYLDVKDTVVRRLSLWDQRNQIPVTSADVGVGVSQLLPLVVASETRSKGIVACEQPELHVHPRVQVGLGDLLTQPAKNAMFRSEAQRQFLIETHSEHLILRVLRRVRETNDGELPEGLSPVEKNSVSIVYLEPTDDGVVAKNIDITDEGDFVQHWPDGFFAERAEELF